MDLQADRVASGITKQNAVKLLYKYHETVAQNYIQNKYVSMSAPVQINLRRLRQYLVAMEEGAFDLVLKLYLEFSTL